MASDNQQIQVEHGDWQDILGRMEDGSADLVLTDPPQGFSGADPAQSSAATIKGLVDVTPLEIEMIAKEFYRVLRDGGTCIVWFDFWRHGILREKLEQAGFDVFRQIIWQKNFPVRDDPSRTYLEDTRLMAVACIKGTGHTFNSTYDYGVYHYGRSFIPRDREHPEMKPIPLCLELIENHSNPGDLVVDPFMGSGTSAVAAWLTGRRFVGGDIDEDWIEYTKELLRYKGWQAEDISTLD